MTDPYRAAMGWLQAHMDVKNIPFPSRHAETIREVLFKASQRRAGMNEIGMQGESGRDLVREASFLLDRLHEHEPCEECAKHYYGHIQPSFERMEINLVKYRGEK